MQKIKNKKLRFLILFPLDILLTLLGILYYKFFKKNHNIFYQSMVRLFCITGGKSNKYINLLTSNKDKLNIEQNNIHNDKIENIVKKIHDNGYFVYDDFLSSDECDDILSFCINSELNIRPNDLKNWSDKIEKTYFNQDNVKAVMYEMPKNKVLFKKNLSDIIFNSEILLICEKYFNGKPIFDHSSLSISTSYSDKPDKKAAQLFHFDLDRPKWLKFLIYVSDVDNHNGPHAFVEGTHKDKGINSYILANGYDRTPDEIVSKYYKDKIKNFIKKKGTLIIEDTRGLHKGTVLKSGFRCLLNIQFNSSNYGTKIEKQEIKAEYVDNKIYSQNKYTYQNLIIK